MAAFVSIALIVLLVILVVAKVLPLFGLDPMRTALDSVYGGSSPALFVTALALGAMGFAVVIYRWRRTPKRGFPWLDVAFYSVFLIVLLVVYVRYPDELHP